MADFFKGILPFLPTIVAVLTIVFGFGAWRRQLVGSRRITLLEDVLTGFYQAKDAIAEIRSPFVFEGEGSTVNPQITSQCNVSNDNQAYYVFIERFSRHQQLFTNLQVQKYRFMATFGAEKAAPFENLNKLVNDLLFTNSFLNHPESGIKIYKPPYDESHKKLLVESRKKLYASTDDPIKKDIDEIIGLIETIVSKEMKKTI
jgi:LPS O-antigen subunit length determinant protein (WzzB/FepE family)